MELQAIFEDEPVRDWEKTAEGHVRFALLGVGYWVREQVIPAIADSDYCETTVIVSGSETKATTLASDIPSIKRGITYQEFHDGVAVDEYDAVYVCTPNALHLEYVETAAAYGKAVLCEKPMEASVERARKMVDVCAQSGVPLMIGYRMQTEPVVRRMRELISDGFIGQPAILTGHMSQPLLELIPDPNQWRLNPDLAGYGSSVMDIGLYPLNTARFLLSSDPVAVQASTASLSEPFSEIDERASFQLEFPDGILAACSASQNATMSSHLRVTGTEGELTINPAFFPSQPRQLTLQRAGTTSSLRGQSVNQMKEEFDYFANCVLTGRGFEANGENGLTDMEVLRAIYDAAESGRRERL